MIAEICDTSLFVEGKYIKILRMCAGHYFLFFSVTKSFLRRSSKQRSQELTSKEDKNESF